MVMREPTSMREVMSAVRGRSESMISMSSSSRTPMCTLAPANSASAARCGRATSAQVEVAQVAVAHVQQRRPEAEALAVARLPQVAGWPPAWPPAATRSALGMPVASASSRLLNGPAASPTAFSTARPRARALTSDPPPGSVHEIGVLFKITFHISVDYAIRGYIISEHCSIK